MPRNAAARVREIAEDLEQLAEQERAAAAAGGDPVDRLQTGAVLGLVWLVVAAAEALDRSGRGGVDDDDDPEAPIGFGANLSR